MKQKHTLLLSALTSLALFTGPAEAQRGARSAPSQRPRIQRPAPQVHFPTRPQTRPEVRTAPRLRIDQARPDVRPERTESLANWRRLTRPQIARVMQSERWTNALRLSQLDRLERISRDRPDRLERIRTLRRLEEQRLARLEGQYEVRIAELATEVD